MSKRPLPDGVFDSIRADYEAHDETCLSLDLMWLGRTGGVSCPSDLDDCTDCGVTFYNEGLTWLNWDAPGDDDEIRVCGCCAVTRGYKLARTLYGITAHAAATDDTPGGDK